MNPFNNLSQNQKDVIEITYQFWGSVLTFFLGLKSYKLAMIPLSLGFIVMVYRSKRKTHQNP